MIVVPRYGNRRLFFIYLFLDRRNDEIFPISTTNQSLYVLEKPFICESKEELNK